MNVLFWFLLPLLHFCLASSLAKLSKNLATTRRQFSREHLISLIINGGSTMTETKISMTIFITLIMLGGYYILRIAFG